MEPSDEMIRAGIEAFKRNIDTDSYEPIMAVDDIVREIFSSMMASAQPSRTTVNIFLDGQEIARAMADAANDFPRVFRRSGPPA